jgi:hypothetical protein
VNGGDQRREPRSPAIYEIRIRGRLGRQWSARLGGLDIAWGKDGDTLLTGPVVDQAALHGLLRKLRDLGVTLISINEKEGCMVSYIQAGNEAAPGPAGAEKARSRDRGMVLSTLWIFALINYIYADIFTAFFDPPAPGTAIMPDGTLMVFAALMETAIAMVLLSRILKRAWNRWLNVLVGLIQTAFVSWSLFGDAPEPFYVFFVCIEVASLLFIAVYAWTWKRD